MEYPEEVRTLHGELEYQESATLFPEAAAEELPCPSMGAHLFQEPVQDLNPETGEVPEEPTFQETRDSRWTRPRRSSKVRMHEALIQEQTPEETLEEGTSHLAAQEEPTSQETERESHRTRPRRSSKVPMHEPLIEEQKPVETVEEGTLHRAAPEEPTTQETEHESHRTRPRRSSKGPRNATLIEDQMPEETLEEVPVLQEEQELEKPDETLEEETLLQVETVETVEPPSEPLIPASAEEARALEPSTAPGRVSAQEGTADQEPSPTPTKVALLQQRVGKVLLHSAAWLASAGFVNTCVAYLQAFPNQICADNHCIPIKESPSVHFLGTMVAMAAAKKLFHKGVAAVQAALARRERRRQRRARKVAATRAKRLRRKVHKRAARRERLRRARKVWHLCTKRRWKSIKRWHIEERALKREMLRLKAEAKIAIAKGNRYEGLYKELHSHYDAALEQLDCRQQVEIKLRKSLVQLGNCEDLPLSSGGSSSAHLMAPAEQLDDENPRLLGATSPEKRGIKRARQSRGRRSSGMSAATFEALDLGAD